MSRAVDFTFTEVLAHERAHRAELDPRPPRALTREDERRILAATLKRARRRAARAARAWAADLGGFASQFPSVTRWG